MDGWRARIGAGAAAALAVGMSMAATSAQAAPEGLERAAEVQLERQVEGFLAANPGAQRVTANQVAWDGGDVVMTFPADAGPGPGLDGAGSAGGLGGVDATTMALSSYGCDAGWSCVYEHAGFGGRKLQFRSCGYQQSLGAYGFANRASSWVNSRGGWTRVYDGGSVLWTEYGYAANGFLGSANDRADYIHLYC